ncbi:molybdopterin molybdotransferase MoeA [Reichenbachiella ulvae]|uniref:Molybdopterin molybdenumtransferase n=1 Tax=Reichenbachiella ulvae TaxID=2980104 RepID=A0ABT3CTG6_9BACT|nr:molybdopterin molybdotransferase MoeA [Reichenbachiella ulvae]MCV9386927.1 molybdopterin molybdotransferase MoeA [Reichenbachiella ulvae]
MISVEEARNIIHSVAVDWGKEEVELHESIGRVLAEEVGADRDFPPFDRVTMDGVAIRSEDYNRGQRRFECVGEQYAGESALAVQEANTCIEIMTGAILGEGVDVVVRYEDVEFVEEEGRRFAVLPELEIPAYKNVHLQGSDHQKGEVLLKEGAIIHAGTVAILATVGMSRVQVKALPKVAVISTGDELVDVNETPKDFQIRKSNVGMIQASLKALNVPCQAFHLMDDKEELRLELSKILRQFDVVLLSGGVSKGKADYLPEILEELGVVKHFHCVAQRPGKPFWFGSIANETVVFAFPGNPISTLACYRYYFLEWMQSQLKESKQMIEAELTEDFSFKPDLGYFLQVEVSCVDGVFLATPKPGNGSGDLANLAEISGFLYLPAGKSVYKKRERYFYFSL